MGKGFLAVDENVVGGIVEFGGIEAIVLAPPVAGAYQMEPGLLHNGQDVDQESIGGLPVGGVSESVVAVPEAFHPAVAVRRLAGFVIEAQRYGPPPLEGADAHPHFGVALQEGGIFGDVYSVLTFYSIGCDPPSPAHQGGKRRAGRSGRGRHRFSAGNLLFEAFLALGEVRKRAGQ